MKKGILKLQLIGFFLLINFSDVFAFFGQELCSHPQFRCITAKNNDTWESLWPDDHDRELVRRFNRTNLPLSPSQWIVVPKHLGSLKYFDLSPFPIQIEPPEGRLLVVDLSKLAFGAYNRKGELLHWGPISGGKDFCPDINEPCQTPLGTFRITRKKGGDCISSQFPVNTNGGAPMPYCMHFYKGIALHGSKALPGRNASHGCIRVYTRDARWLNESFAMVGTKIQIIASKNSTSH